MKIIYMVYCSKKFAKQIYRNNHFKKPKSQQNFFPIQFLTKCIFNLFLNQSFFQKLSKNIKINYLISYKKVFSRGQIIQIRRLPQLLFSNKKRLSGGSQFLKFVNYSQKITRNSCQNYFGQNSNQQLQSNIHDNSKENQNKTQNLFRLQKEQNQNKKANKLIIQTIGEYVGLEDILANQKRTYTAIVISADAKLYACSMRAFLKLVHEDANLYDIYVNISSQRKDLLVSQNNFIENMKAKLQFQQIKLSSLTLEIPYSKDKGKYSKQFRQNKKSTLQNSISKNNFTDFSQIESQEAFLKQKEKLLENYEIDQFPQVESCLNAQLKHKLLVRKEGKTNVSPKKNDSCNYLKKLILHNQKKFNRHLRQDQTKINHFSSLITSINQTSPQKTYFHSKFIATTQNPIVQLPQSENSQRSTTIKPQSKKLIKFISQKTVGFPFSPKRFKDSQPKFIKKSESMRGCHSRQKNNQETAYSQFYHMIEMNSLHKQLKRPGSCLGSQKAEDSRPNTASQIGQSINNAYLIGVNMNISQNQLRKRVNTSKN